MLSSMTPTIVLKDGKPFLLVGSPGGRSIINTVAQIILNVIDFDMDLAQAVRAGRIHHQWFPDRIQAEREALKEKATARVDLSRPLDLDLDDDPVAEYILFEGDRRVPKDKVELVRRGRAHIAAEIRRVVERVEVEKGQPVKVIPKA